MGRDTICWVVIPFAAMSNTFRSNNKKLVFLGDCLSFPAWAATTQGQSCLSSLPGRYSLRAGPGSACAGDGGESLGKSQKRLDLDRPGPSTSLASGSCGPTPTTISFGYMPPRKPQRCSVGRSILSTSGAAGSRSGRLTGTASGGRWSGERITPDLLESGVSP